MNMKNVPYVILPTEDAREELRRRASKQTDRLARSVARLTSYDDPCVEYADEVFQERTIIDDILYYQQCRVALERCLANKSAVLRYKRQDGTMRTVLFRRMSLGRVKIQGLV